MLHDQLLGLLLVGQRALEICGAKAGEGAVRWREYGERFCLWNEKGLFISVVLKRCNNIYIVIGFLCGMGNVSSLQEHFPSAAVLREPEELSICRYVTVTLCYWRSLGYPQLC